MIRGLIIMLVVRYRTKDLGGTIMSFSIKTRGAEYIIHERNPLAFTITCYLCIFLSLF